jgi:hypothetical protein
MASLFRRSRKSAPSRPPARARLALEPLEDRAVPATFTVTLPVRDTSTQKRERISRESGRNLLTRH